MEMWWLFVLAAVISSVLTGLVRFYALHKSLLDIPNERSSHAKPIPRGGGIAIVLTYLAALPLLTCFGYMTVSESLAFGGAGVLAATIGFIDDHGHIPAPLRLLAHFFAAIWGIYWLGGFFQPDIFGFHIGDGLIAQIILVIYLVWLLNLYNFMDGIDGIASIEAITVCLGGAILYWADNSGDMFWVNILLLMVIVGGFLFWNFPQAKIFMGDAGSGFLGLILGLYSVQAANHNPELFWAWIILLGIFIVDATVTLFRRVLRGDKFYEAHCSHAYQYAARKLGAHKSVSLMIGLINLVWLLPIAFLVAIGSLNGVLGVLIAYAPLVLIAYYFKAGLAEN